MQGSSLSTTNGTGSEQSSAQDPQTSTANTGNTTVSVNQVQPQTTGLQQSASALTLNNSNTDVVNLNAARTGTVSSPSIVTVKHHVSYGLLAITALLIIAAIGISWATIRGDYSTTE